MNTIKHELRSKILRRRRELDEVFRRTADGKIVEKIMQNLFYRESNFIAFYASDGFEVDLSELFRLERDNKAFFLPRYNAAKALYEMVKVRDLERDLTVGKYGLLEPDMQLAAASDAELEQMFFLVPGVAFDERCHRLGRGKGFYDRLLLKSKYRLGVFYECQKEAEIPQEAHDLTLDSVITEQRIYHNSQEQKKV